MWLTPAQDRLFLEAASERRRFFDRLVFAGEPAATKDAITQNPTASRLRLGAAYAPLVGLKTEFGGLGKFNSAFTPKPLGGGRNYNYDDGFVRVDSSDNMGDQTWNWSYDNDSQFNAADGGSLT